jgi:RNase P/RNase MRP subunit p30
LIHQSKLDSYLSDLPGFDLLASFLRDHRNSSSRFVTVHATQNQTVAELHELWLQHAVLPSKASLFNADLRNEIAKIFTPDAALVALALQV